MRSWKLLVVLKRLRDNVFILIIDPDLACECRDFFCNDLNHYSGIKLAPADLKVQENKYIYEKAKFA